MEMEEIKGDFKPELIPVETGGDIEDYEEALHVLMKFVGSMTSALEQVSGRGANAIVYQAGKRMGHEAGKLAEKTDNLEKALDELREILGIDFYFEMWKPSDQEGYTIEKGDETVVKLLFMDCVVRQTLRRTGQPQKGPFCYLLYGYMVGAVEEVMDIKGKLDIDHVGPNACLKTLTIKWGGK
ncbi:MAG: hydrocarbon binding protein (contains V4R domain) [Methanobacteriaceae archaeon]|jgi:predicted hydrocarbon binding protein|nr:MAG: hydrocarbon binding protein (contains V4R domain) [Methanobacterium sp. BRmetb2]MCC7557473.1 hydrocarbon binding protein (contains V4R domain) [Methanobacteriaceae archaeon]